MKHLFIAVSSLLLILLAGCMDEDAPTSTSSNRILNIRVEFICFIPTSVRIIHDNNWSAESQLTHTGNGVFKYSYTSSTQNVLMNIAFFRFGAPQDTTWICSLKGIGQANVYINDKLITNDYLVYNYKRDGSNISLAFNDNGSLAPGSGSHLTIVNVPPEVAHPVYYIDSLNNPPPSVHKCLRVGLLPFMIINFQQKKVQLKLNTSELV